MKKTLKRVGALILALVLVLSTAVTALADPGTQVGTGASNVPTADDRGTVTVKNVEPGLTVTAYHIVEGNYVPGGMSGYKYVAPVTSADIADMEKPTSDEITRLAAVAPTAITGDTNKVVLNDNGDGTYAAELGAGYWIIVVSGLNEDTEKIYNPMLAGVYYNVDGDTVPQTETVSVGSPAEEKTLPVYRDAEGSRYYKDGDNYYKEGALTEPADLTEAQKAGLIALTYPKIMMEVRPAETAPVKETVTVGDPGEQKILPVYTDENGNKYYKDGDVYYKAGALTTPADVTGLTLTESIAPAIDANTNWKLTTVDAFAKSDSLVPIKEIKNNTKEDPAQDSGKHGDDASIGDVFTFKATVKVPNYSELYSNYWMKEDENGAYYKLASGVYTTEAPKTRSDVYTDNQWNALTPEEKNAATLAINNENAAKYDQDSKGTAVDGFDQYKTFAEDTAKLQFYIVDQLEAGKLKFVKENDAYVRMRIAANETDLEAKDFTALTEEAAPTNDITYAKDGGSKAEDFHQEFESVYVADPAGTYYRKADGTYTTEASEAENDTTYSKVAYNYEMTINEAEDLFTIWFSPEMIKAYGGQTVELEYYAELLDGADTNFGENTNDLTVFFTNDPETGRPGKKKDRTYQYTFEIDGSLDGDEENGGANQNRHGREFVKTGKQEQVGTVITFKDAAGGEMRAKLHTDNRYYVVDADGDFVDESGAKITGLDSTDPEEKAAAEAKLVKAVEWTESDVTSWSTTTAPMGLEGATFQLTYKAREDRTVPVEYVEDAAGTYYKKKDGSYTTDAPTDANIDEYESDTVKYKQVPYSQVLTTTTDAGGRINFRGLDTGYYELEEIAPAPGYSLSTEKYTVLITAEYYNDDVYAVQAVAVDPTDDTEKPVFIDADGNDTFEDTGVKKMTTEGVTSATEGAEVLFHKGELKSYAIARVKKAYADTVDADFETLEDGQKTVYTETRHLTSDGNYDPEITETYEGADTTFIQNIKTPSLPSTGGVGTYLFTIAGVALIAIAAFLLIFKRRNELA